VKALQKILTKLSPESTLYADSAYTDYVQEDNALKNYGIQIKTQRKTNSKRPDTRAQTIEKLKMRKRIEVAISDIKKLFSRTIHAVTINGFLIKLTLFIFGLQLNKMTN